MTQESLDELDSLADVFFDSFSFFGHAFYYRLVQQIAQQPFNPFGAVIVAFDLARQDTTGNFKNAVQNVIVRRIRQKLFPEGLNSRVMTQKQAVEFFYDFIYDHSIGFILNPLSEISAANKAYHRLKNMSFIRKLLHFEWAKIVASKIFGILVALWVLVFKFWMIATGIVMISNLANAADTGKLPALSQSNPFVQDKTLGRKRQRP